MGNGIAINSITGIFASGATFTFQFLSSIVVLRVLGPEAAGIFFIFISLNQLASTIFCMGIPTANTMILGKSKYSFNEVNFNSLLLSFIIGVFCIMMYALFKPWVLDYLVKDMDPNLILLSIALIPAVVYSQAWMSMMVGTNRVMLLNKFLFWQGLVGFLFIIIFLLFIMPNIYGAVIAWSSMIVLSFAIMFFIGSRIEPLSFKFNRALFKESISFGTKVHAGGVATMIWQRIDAFFLNYYHGKIAVGYYSLAVNITEILWRVVTPVANAVNSTITGSEKKSAGEMTAKTVRHVAFMLSVSGIILCVLSPVFIRVIYGNVYLPSVKPLLILMPGTIAVGIAIITSIFFANTLNKPLLLSGLAWINAVINIILCFIFIPGYAENGAALASSLTYCFGIILVIIFLQKELKIRVKDIIVIKKEDFSDYILLLKDIKTRYLLKTYKNK